MSFKARILVALLANLLALGMLSGTLAQAQIGGQSIIVNPRPGELQVFVSVDRDPTGRGHPTYHIGDSIAVTVAVSRDAFVYVFSIHADGVVNLILPNGLTEDPLRLRGGQSLTFPRAQDEFSLTIAGPPGVDRVLAVASLQPLSLDQVARVRRGEIATAQVQGADDLAEALAIIVEPIPSDRWATATASFTVARLVPVLPRPLPLQGALSVDSTPRGAQVLIDNVLRGVTPARIDLPPGSYELRLRHVGFEEFVSTFTIRPGVTSSVNARLTAVAQRGTLQVVANVAGAEVWVHNARIGVSPLITTLDEGTYLLQVRAPGFEEFQTSVAVQAGRVTRVDATLRRLSGNLRVIGAPEGAYVFVDGAPVGRVSGGILEVSGVAAGQRELTVIAPGHRTSITQVNVIADRRVDARVSLTRF